MKISGKFRSRAERTADYYWFFNGTINVMDRFFNELIVIELMKVKSMYMPTDKPCLNQWKIFKCLINLG